MLEFSFVAIVAVAVVLAAAACYAVPAAVLSQWFARYQFVRVFGTADWRDSRVANRLAELRLDRRAWQARTALAYERAAILGERGRSVCSALEASFVSRRFRRPVVLLMRFLVRRATRPAERRWWRAGLRLARAEVAYAMYMYNKPLD